MTIAKMTIFEDSNGESPRAHTALIHQHIVYKSAPIARSVGFYESREATFSRPGMNAVVPSS